MYNTHYYKMLSRPFDIGTYPLHGFVELVSTGNKQKDGYHAVLEYSRELTSDEMSRFEFAPLNEPVYDPVDMLETLRDQDFPSYIYEAAEDTSSLEEVFENLMHMRTEIARAAKFLKSVKN